MIAPREVMPIMPRVVLPSGTANALRAQLAETGLTVADGSVPAPGDLVWLDPGLAGTERVALAQETAAAGAHLVGTCLPTSDWPALQTLLALFASHGQHVVLVSPLLGTVAGLHLTEAFRQEPPISGYLAVRSRPAPRGAGNLWTDDAWAAASYVVALHGDEALAVTGASLENLGGELRLIALLRSSSGVLWSLEAGAVLPAGGPAAREAEVELLSTTQVVRAEPFKQGFGVTGSSGGSEWVDWARSPEVTILLEAGRKIGGEAYRQHVARQQERAVHLVRSLQEATGWTER